MFICLATSAKFMWRFFSLKALHVHACFNVKRRCVLPTHFIFVCLVILRTCDINPLFYFVNNLSVLQQTGTRFLYICHMTSHEQTLSPQRGASQNTCGNGFQDLIQKGPHISRTGGMVVFFLAWIALGRI